MFNYCRYEILVDIAHMLLDIIRTVRNGIVDKKTTNLQV